SSRLKQTTSLKPNKVILFEGIFSLYDEEIRELSDITAFLHVEADIRFIRRLHRDVEERGRSLDSVINQYYETVRPMYQQFLDPQRQYANFIVGEETDIAATILAAKVNELFSPLTKTPHLLRVQAPEKMNMKKSLKQNPLAKKLTKKKKK
ncbi:MAG: hypothetical protein L6Q33_07890, partial [Bacteriovoracaceae bacterium]|nr:hypothetical protein [Bacteriovoracaceae bacterium]